LSLAFSPDGKRIACGGGNRLRSGGVQFFDAQTGEKLLFVKEPNGAATGVAYSPDGKRLASGSSGKAVRIWDADSGQELLSLKGHTGTVRGVAFSPDGKRLATLSEPLMLKVFDTQTGQETLSLKGGNAGGLAFSPNGHILAGGAWNEVILYDATPLPEKP
jgi:eukaryotic-like serine/threonine-protein kinase